MNIKTFADGNELSTEERELLAYLLAEEGIELSQTQSLPPIISAPEKRHQPFPLTNIQQAYWIGRSETLELGNVAAHAYWEIESADLDLERYEKAWQRLIERHEMLRTIVLPSGEQQILDSVPPYQIQVLDLCQESPNVRASRLSATRQEMSHQIMLTDCWPLFDIRVSVLNERCIRQHISFDLLIGDDWSLQVLLQELWEFYQDADAPLGAIAVSFRDYVLACVALQGSCEFERSRDYWLRRIPTLPPAPELPLAKHPSLVHSPRFVRRSATLQPEIWQQLKTRANQVGLTPSGVLLAAFAEVLNVWSKFPQFTINLTLFNRLPLHPEVNKIVGDFTTLSLLAVDNSTLDSFVTHARNIQEQLWSDLDHRYFDGVQVLRELACIQDKESKALMPVVFTSTLTLTEAGQNTDPFAPFGSVVYSITQTPQVWLDHQVYEEEETLVCNWDAVEELFPGGLLDDMFEAYYGFLFRLANDESAWLETRRQLLPNSQLELFAAINATTAPAPNSLLHTLFESQVKQHPHHAAIIALNRTLTYQELHSLSQALGHRLRHLGAKPNTLVAVVMEKGWEQVVAVLGILVAGAAYIPIDPGLPIQRRSHLLEQAEVQLILTQSKLNQTLEWPAGVCCICVDTEELVLQKNDLALHPVQQSEDLAYVIYTSGSTGMPKGVMIDHRGAVNTILDINKRFDVNSSDRVFALSSLSFDLSVYDIFGTLATGATIVIPQANAAKDPSYWLDAIAHQQITVWNSVPAQMQMLVEYAYGRSEFSLDSLRLVLLSGDWLPLTLPSRIKAMAKNAQVISLGGATEASVWSILYPIETIDSTWKSIPYGCPMTNQQFYILNEALEPCPVWVPGQLYIGGTGLAKGYWRDEQKTASSFITHPVTGSRLYRTGDLGCYLPNGQIEFLGREDYQVKVGGYRIELGEIEAALVQHSAVHQAVVTVFQQQSNKRLVAYVVPVQKPAPTVDELRHFLSEKLPEYMIPFAFMVLDALPLTSNGKVDRRALPAPEQVKGEFELEIPITLGRSRTEYAAPRTPIEKILTEIWAEVLAVKPIGIHDNFFALGGNSILIMQAIARAKQAGIQLTPRQMFGHPTIVEVAAVASTATAICTEQEPVTGLVPLTPIQHFLLELDLPNSYPWNLTWLLEVRQKVDVSLLEAAFQHLLLYHDALRLRFERNISGWEQYNASPGAAIAFERINLSHISTINRQQAIDATAAELLASFDLSQEPLIGVVLFELDYQKSDLLLIVAHHLVIDAVSMRFLVEDLQTVYQQLSCGQPIQLPPKSTSFQQWSKQLTEYAQSDKIQQELSYWLETLPKQANPLPVDYPQGINTEYSSHTVSRFLNEKETHVLLREFPIYDTQAQEVLLASLLCAMSRWTGESSLLLNFLGHGREEILEYVDVSRTVGWFTSIYPMFLDMGNGDTLEDTLRMVKHQIQRIPNRGIGYGIVRYLTSDIQVAQKLRSLPQPEVAFNYFGQVDFSQASLFQFAPESPGTIRQKQGNRPHLLDVIGVISEDRLEMNFIYSENIHRQSTIESLAEYFMETVRSLISSIVRL
ncbi:MAG: amino acid adenylation domain-containing protein [Nostoc desertorum CM1-VF14]|jgi:amino acid adenylation domain-containing protein/non-ribosomal peptide synthase protein (TIGR01720 family)|nr:amino acid adenylation domain-containing protein [Nostoc desertorum CM1-VF14]